MIASSPTFFLVAALAILIVGISKGGFGGGLGVMAVPLMALVVPPLQAAAIMLPILCVMDIAGLKAFWRRWDPVNLRIMLPGAMLGILVAVLTYGWVSEDMLRILVGGIAIGFALNYYFSSWLTPRRAQPRNWMRGGLWSALAGFTSFSAHAGGPPVSIYLLPQRLEKTHLVATTVAFFAVVNYAKLIPYAWLGQFEPRNLMTSLVLSPLAVVGIYLGVYLHTRVSEHWFYRVCYLFLLLTGLRLFYQGAFL